MGKSTYPATNNQEAVDLNILNANAFHMVLNGDATTDVPTYEGNGTIPSVAKALHTMAAYKAPIPWEEGISEADILQPRTFADNIFVPIRVPAVMDSIPSDLYWKLYFPTVGESLNDTGENYFREVLEETKSTFVVPFDIKTYLVNGVERPQVTVFVHKENDVVEKIDVAELTYVDKNTFTLLNPATAGNIVEIYSTTIAAFTIVGAIRDDVYLAKDEVHADRLVAEQASTDAQDARDVAIAQRDVVIAEGDTQVARVVSEGTQQVALATEQAVRAEAAASVAEEASSKAYAPQSIIRAPIGPRPVGWTAADCDAPVQSMSAESAVIVNNDVLPVFSGSNSSGGMVVSAQSIYSSTYPVWKAFNKQAVNYTDSWQSGNDFASGTGVGSSWIQVDMGRQVNVARIVLYPRNEDVKFNTNFPYDFDIVIDGVKVKEVRNAIPPSRTARMEFDLDSPVTGQTVRLDITRTGGASVTSLGQFYVYDAEVVSGSSLVQIAAGLQVAYADEGRVQLSDVLDSAHALDLSAAADGTHYVYADIAEDGTFSGFGHTPNKPMVGTERSGAGDHYNPVTVTHYNSSDVPIRRVYIGTAEKVSGVITSVHCYSLGSSVTLPVYGGELMDKGMNVWEELPFVLSKNASAEAQIVAEGHWGSSGWLFSPEGGVGVRVNILANIMLVHAGADLLTAPNRVRVTVDRGY